MNKKIRKAMERDYKEPIRTAMTIIICILGDCEEKLGKEYYDILQNNLEIVKKYIQTSKQNKNDQIKPQL